MPRTIRFHLDEHVHPAVAQALRRRGIEVTTTAEASLRGASDVDQLDFAVAHGRVIVTNDADFLRLFADKSRHAGIAYCHQQSRSVGEMIRALEMIWEILEPDEMHDHVEFI